MHPEQSSNDVLESLVDWAESGHTWWLEGLKRLARNGDLGEKDINDLTALCLEPDDENHKTAYDIVFGARGSDTVCLESISSPTNINALGSVRPLEFGATGLTIVYGDNGSGKSGYVRILKHACFSRDKTKILPPLSARNAGPPSAVLSFQINGQSKTFHWTESNASDELRSINVFDTRAGEIGVEKENKVAFVPYAMELLGKLKDASDAITQNLNAQISELEKQTPLSIAKPSIESSTSAGAYLSSLTARSNIQTLELLCGLSDEDLSRISRLELDLAQDANAASKRMAASLNSIRSIRNEITSHSNAATPDSVAELEHLSREAQAKLEAQDAAREVLFSNSKLPEIGGNAWKELWNAARQYSNTQAYPQSQFPSSNDIVDPLCVLCHQPLGELELQRLQTFEEFVKSSAETESRKANTALEAKNNALKQAEMTLSRIREAIAIIESELGTELGEKVRKSLIVSKLRLRALRQSRVPTSSYIDNPMDEINAAVEDYELRIEAIRKGEDSSAYQALQEELAELQARRTLSAIKGDVVAEVNRRKEIEALESANKLARKRPITDKNKEISDKLVTDRLRGAFAREIEKLELATAPIELKKMRDGDATSFFQIQFLERPSQRVSDVFSEGEHRCVGLAAFLAELSTLDNNSAIVFDDPYTSLDPIHREYLATRLIEESKSRQVIIFTHDLSFLFTLNREADIQEMSNIAYQTIEKRQGVPGQVLNEPPHKAKKTLAITSELKTLLKSNKNILINGREIERVVFAKGMIEQLREAWDQALADFIRPVLVRFDSRISTSSVGKLTVLTDEDTDVIVSARRRLSDQLHYPAEAINPKSVSAEDLLKEINAIELWVRDYQDRQSKIK